MVRGTGPSVTVVEDNGDGVGVGGAYPYHTICDSEGLD